MKFEILHVIQQLSGGGAGRALEALMAGAQASRHRVVSLIPATPGARARLRAQSIPLLEQPGSDQLDEWSQQADVVQIHFWNTPELYSFMSVERSCRIVIWSHVMGSTAPHILIPELADYSHTLVHTCMTSQPMAITIRPCSPHNFAVREPFPGGDQPLHVGIFGSLHSSRMCAEALDVFAMADCPQSRLVVVGQGDLVRQWQCRVLDLNLQGRVLFKGFVSDVGRELGDMDVLLHLPKPGCFATSDLALQEAMLAGVVPVVLAGTPVSELVRHNVDGLVSADMHQCVHDLQKLFADRQLLMRMRLAGQQRARRDFSPVSCARAFEDLYERISKTPRAPRCLQLRVGSSGAERFMASLGNEASPFRISAQRSLGWQEADDQIASSDAALVGAGAGGILHWRGAYPTDTWLRYWAGLAFFTAGRFAMAAAEFAAAAQAGTLGAAERLDRCLRTA